MIQHPSDETELAQCDDSEEEENARRTRRNPRNLLLHCCLIVMTYVTWQVIIIALLALAATKVVQLIRIYGTTKAPVMNYAAETSLGVVTIRAFGTVDRFFKNYLNLVVADDVLSFCLMQPWSGFSYVGLSLSYALTLTQTQVFITRWIKQYMSIPAEPPAVVDDKRPPSSWPSNGTIHLQELKIRYRPTAPLVLVGYGPDPPKSPT
ncbi:hypothetical protein F2Q68_00016977 [Brassica cretica]|uniref:ABC transmembrane type-1 domain-containing protein n=1 Tax=Brassica cretica TaxID=69181 RepID=A0A8S9HL54_BRACR|nr:hypothetical protein F2Q68_00016977 [Brassica cretica]